jgi:hypothetical protein
MGFASGFVHDYDQLLVCRTLLGFVKAGHWPCGIKRRFRSFTPGCQSACRRARFGRHIDETFDQGIAMAGCPANDCLSDALGVLAPIDCCATSDSQD